MNNPEAQAAGAAATTSSAPTAKAIHSSDLLGSARMLKIEHQGAVYVLRATSKGGLILTK